MSKNEIVEQNNELVEKPLPVFDNRGFEDLDDDIIIHPIAKVLQLTSTELMDDDVEGLRAGDIINSITKEKLEGSFIPIKLYNDNIMFVPKNDDEKKALKEKVKAVAGVELSESDMDGMFICRSTPEKRGDKLNYSCKSCPFAKFDGNKNPICAANINILGYFEGSPIPMIIRFSKTSYKNGKQAVSMFRMMGTLFGGKYKLKSTKRQGNGNTWYELSVLPAGKCTPEELASAESLFNIYRTVELNTQEEHHEEVAPVKTVEPDAVVEVVDKVEVPETEGTILKFDVD